MLTQKLMKDMEHPPPAEAATSGVFPPRTAVILRLWWVFISPNLSPLPLTELCGFCRKPLSRTQPAVRALDCLFHVECFTCFKCEKQLQGQQFYNVDEKPFCEDCYAVSHCDGSCWREPRLLQLLSLALPSSFHPARLGCRLPGVGSWINVSLPVFFGLREPWKSAAFANRPSRTGC